MPQADLSFQIHECIMFLEFAAAFRVVRQLYPMYGCEGGPRRLHSIVVRTNSVIWMRISDPRSVWIMVHQRNQ